MVTGTRQHLESERSKEVLDDTVVKLDSVAGKQCLLSCGPSKPQYKEDVSALLCLPT